jgi:hypothetical protein
MALWSRNKDGASLIFLGRAMQWPKNHRANKNAAVEGTGTGTCFNKPGDIYIYIHI